MSPNRLILIEFYYNILRLNDINSLTTIVSKQKLNK